MNVNLLMFSSQWKHEGTVIYCRLLNAFSVFAEKQKKSRSWSESSDRCSPVLTETHTHQHYTHTYTTTLHTHTYTTALHTHTYTTLHTHTHNTTHTHTHTHTHTSALHTHNTIHTPNTQHHTHTKHYIHTHTHTHTSDIRDYLHKWTALDPSFKSLSYQEPALTHTPHYTHTHTSDIRDYLHRWTALDPSFKSLSYQDPALTHTTHTHTTLHTHNTTHTTLHTTLHTHTHTSDIRDYLHRWTALDPSFKSLSYQEPALTRARTRTHAHTHTHTQHHTHTPLIYEIIFIDGLHLIQASSPCVTKNLLYRTSPLTPGLLKS